MDILSNITQTCRKEFNDFFNLLRILITTEMSLWEMCFCILEIVAGNTCVRYCLY